MMFRLVLYCVLFLFLVEQTVTEGCQQEAQQGCKVTDGHAQCESWNLSASIHNLPPCTTRITFSLIPNPSFYGRYVLVQFNEANFSRLTNLQDLELYTNHGNHSHVRLVVTESTALASLKHVNILRFRMLQDSIGELNDANLNMYSNLKSLKILDLSRAKRIGLTSATHIIGAESTIQKLILKNIQEITRAKTHTPSADLEHFVCQSNVQYLDLSFNDIAYITFSGSEKCASNLKYINLDCNILAGFKRDEFSLLPALSLMASLETFNARMSDSPKYQDGLWNNDDNKEGNIIPKLEKDYVKLAPLAAVLQNTPLAFLAGYDNLLQDILKNCGNFDYFDVAKCIVHDNDLCEVFHCLSPTLDKEACPGDISDQLNFFAERMCNYRSCSRNMPFPMPPKLNSLFVQNAGKYIILNEYPDVNRTTLCIHPHNNLEYVDASNMNFEGFKDLPLVFNYSMTGLTKLKYLNAQGCQLSLVHIKIPSPDMQSLRELHIGGNILTTNGILPTEMLQKQTQLSVLNLLNANLQGFEASSFETHHHLSVLDLSYNNLKVSSLGNLDLSKTIIKSLNLSYNSYTALPKSFRDQLNNMQDLELYLSGNTFICSCENMEILHWIQSNTQITFHYAGDHDCTDSPGNTIHNIGVDSLHCDWYWMQPIIIICSSLALLLVILAIVSIYKKRYSISNLIFRL